MPKILLDTDIGTDSDDAVCLCYLLLHPDCELVGVTTVGPDASVRAEIARKLCDHLDRSDVPVVAGADRPTLPNHYWFHHEVNQHIILDSEPERRRSRPREALQLMRRVIRDSPGEVILLTVGPTTNAALLATVDPETVSLLKGVFTMGGRFRYEGESPRIDCNIMLDPGAALALSSRELPGHTFVGVDVTGGLGLNREQMETVFAGERLAPLRQCCEAWIEKKESGGTGLHDPFTAACIVEPDLSTWERGRVGLKFSDRDLARGFELDDDQVTGHAYFESESAGPHRVATGADRERYYWHLEKIFDAAR